MVFTMWLAEHSRVTYVSTSQICLNGEETTRLGPAFCSSSPVQIALCVVRRPDIPSIFAREHAHSCNRLCTPRHLPLHTRAHTRLLSYPFRNCSGGGHVRQPIVSSGHTQSARAHDHFSAGSHSMQPHASPLSPPVRAASLRLKQLTPICLLCGSTNAVQARDQVLAIWRLHGYHGIPFSRTNSLATQQYLRRWFAPKPCGHRPSRTWLSKRSLVRM